MADLKRAFVSERELPRVTRSQREAAAAIAQRAERLSLDVPLCPNIDADGLPNLPAETGDGLSPTQRLAIGALVAGHTNAMAARAAGVDRRTLFRWRQVPAFQRVLDEISREALDATATRVRNLMLRATRVLGEGMIGPQAFACAMRVANSTRLWAALAAADTKLGEDAFADHADDKPESAADAGTNENRPEVGPALEELSFT